MNIYSNYITIFRLVSALKTKHSKQWNVTISIYSIQNNWVDQEERV